MQRVISLISLLLISAATMAQTSETRYYKDQRKKKEVSADKATFCETVTHNSDGSVTREWKNLRTRRVESSETYKGNEPTGIWKYRTGHGMDSMDYSFPLVYSDRICTDTIAGLKDYFKNNDSLHYVAPKLEGGDFMNVLVKNLVYPSAAKDENISGRVVAAITITANGKVENVVVTKGTHKLLDKETVRVFRELKFLSGPTLNGQPISVCVTLPLSFTLE